RRTRRSRPAAAPAAARAAASRGSGPASRRSLAVGLLEPFELFVAALDGRVDALLGRLLAGPDALEFLVDDRADLDEVAQAHAARLVGGLADHLRHRDVRARVLLVEAALVGQLVGGLGHRQVAGALVAFRGHLGPGEVGEELRHALVLGRLLAG